MNIIINNPYRQLGVYSNSPIKERVSNHNRLKAFLKVGRQVDFPLDLTTYLPPVNRTSETVAQAEANLTLPKEQLRYAQFWFMKVTPLDDIAFNHLLAGNMAEAISILEKRDNASSLQNRLVCALINKEYPNAIACAESLYSQYLQQFETIVLGDESKSSSETLAFDFIDTLCDELSANVIRPIVRNESWFNHINEKSVKPIVERIQSAIETAKASKGKGSTARYDAGVKLMNDAKVPLQQLRTFLPTTDLQYQMIADKLGLEILQCGIDYYNGSEEADAAHKAMPIQRYAMEIVVGKMAKDRCKENVDILQNIIKNLPPMEVFAEDKAIKEELGKFCQLPEKISHAVTLLNNTKRHLQSIKSKLGADNTYYLKMSTLVVSNALHNIIEEVNAVQQDQTIEIGGQQVPMSFLLDRDGKMRQIRKTLQAAWEATLIMDTFEMEPEFKTKRYLPNRSTLKDLCNQMGISTSTTFVRRNPQPSTTTTSSKTYQPSTPQNTSTTSKVPSSSDETNWGCIVAIIIAVIIGLLSSC